MTVKIDVPTEFDKEIEFLSSRQYQEKYHVHSACAQTIRDFEISRKNFAAYVSLKTGGIDFWSRKSVSAIQEFVPNAAGAYEIAKQYFAKEKQAVSCIRWYARGLPLADAIRRELVSEEIAANCRN